MKIPNLRFKVNFKVPAKYKGKSTAAGFLLIQLLGALAILIGISWWAIPVALIVGGVGAIVAIEMQSNDSSASVEANRRKIDDALKTGQNPFERGVPLENIYLQYVELATRNRPLTK